MALRRALLPLLALVACARPEPAEAPPPAAPEQPAMGVEPCGSRPEPVAEPALREPPPWDGAAPVESNAGSYVIQYRTVPETIPWGDPFELDVWVLDNGAEPSLASGVALSIDAAMPEHGHGMNRVPVVKPTADGGFAVEGMLFHMPGRWELYFDVSALALTERAQIEVLLD